MCVPASTNTTFSTSFGCRCAIQKATNPPYPHPTTLTWSNHQTHDANPRPPISTAFQIIKRTPLCKRKKKYKHKPWGREIRLQVDVSFPCIVSIITVYRKKNRWQKKMHWSFIDVGLRPSRMLWEGVNYIPSHENDASALVTKLPNWSFLFPFLRCLPASPKKDRGNSPPGSLISVNELNSITTAITKKRVGGVRFSPRCEKRKKKKEKKIFHPSRMVSKSASSK